jgi:hypothetical protein
MLELVKVSDVVLHSVQNDTSLLDLSFYECAHGSSEVFLHNVDICKSEGQTLDVVNSLYSEEPLAKDGRVTSSF